MGYLPRRTIRTKDDAIAVFTDLLTLLNKPPDQLKDADLSAVDPIISALENAPDDFIPPDVKKAIRDQGTVLCSVVDIFSRWRDLEEISKGEDFRNLRELEDKFGVSNQNYETNEAEIANLAAGKLQLVEDLKKLDVDLNNAETRFTAATSELKKERAEQSKIQQSERQLQVDVNGLKVKIGNRLFDGVDATHHIGMHSDKDKFSKHIFGEVKAGLLDLIHSHNTN